MDKLALEEAGFLNVVSVPDGAPAKVKEGAVPAPDVDTKYSYLWNCRAVLDQATRVLMATDNDPPGHALAEELARRLGQSSPLSGVVSACRSPPRPPTPPTPPPTSLTAPPPPHPPSQPTPSPIPTTPLLPVPATPPPPLLHLFPPSWLGPTCHVHVSNQHRHATCTPGSAFSAQAQTRHC